MLEQYCTGKAYDKFRTTNEGECQSIKKNEGIIIEEERERQREREIEREREREREREGGRERRQ